MLHGLNLVLRVSRFGSFQHVQMSAVFCAQISTASEKAFASVAHISRRVAFTVGRAVSQACLILSWQLVKLATIACNLKVAGEVLFPEQTSALAFPPPDCSTCLTHYFVAILTFNSS